MNYLFSSRNLSPVNCLGLIDPFRNITTNTHMTFIWALALGSRHQLHAQRIPLQYMNSSWRKGTREFHHVIIHKSVQCVCTLYLEFDWLVSAEAPFICCNVKIMWRQFKQISPVTRRFLFVEPSHSSLGHSNFIAQEFQPHVSRIPPKSLCRSDWVIRSLLVYLSHKGSSTFPQPRPNEIARRHNTLGFLMFGFQHR